MCDYSTRILSYRCYCQNVTDWSVNANELFAGFDEYRIVHRRSEGGGKYKYSAVHNKDEIPVELYLSDASETRDPLKEIQMINLRVDGQKFITGIDDNGDCVIRKWWIVFLLQLVATSLSMSVWKKPS